MDNVFTILVQSVYKDMRPYQGKDELIYSIRNARKKKLLSRLAATMTDAIIKVIEKKGAFICS